MPEPVSPILQAAALFRAELERSDAQAMNRLIDAYRRAYRRLAGQIDALLLETAEQGLTQGKLMRLERYRALMGQIGDELQGFQSLTMNEVETAAQIGIKLGEQHGREMVSIGATGGPQVAGMFNRLPVEAIKQMVGFLEPGGPLYTRLKLLAPNAASLVADAITSGITLGYNPRKTAQLVQDAFGAGLTDALRTVRTSQLWAYREANRASYVANSVEAGGVVEGWYWHAAMSARTCGSCLAMHGTFHPLGEQLNDHPNGRCAMIPAVIGREPPVPPGSGEVWFKAQPESVQQQILGKGRFEAWKAGKFEFGALTTTNKIPVYGEVRTVASLKDLIGANGAASAQGAGNIVLTANRSMDAIAAAKEKFLSSLTEDERAAIVRWGQTGRPLRAFQSGDLSGLTPEQIKTARRDLPYWDSALKKAPTFQGEVVRGLHDIPDSVIDSWVKGATIELKNDQSATYGLTVGKDFAGVNGRPDKQSVIWFVDQKSGKDLMELTNVTYGGKSVSEQEIIIQKGTRYEIVKKEYWYKGELWDDKKLEWYFEGSGYSPTNPPPNWRLDHEKQGVYHLFLKEIK